MRNENLQNQCQTCGKAFHVKRCEQTERKYCSKACFRKHHARTCPNCGVVFTPSKERVCCSNACHVAYAKRYKMENYAAIFWSYIDRSGDCWEWQGTHNEQGYGCFDLNKKRRASHRVAYELTHGTIPDGLLVLHRCDNPPCCNPDHLFLGTHKDNADDCAAKGRLSIGGGKRIEDNEIPGLIDRYKRGGITQQELADAYGVSRSLVSFILSGKRRAVRP